MMSTLRNATDTITTSVGDAVDAVRDQIDGVTGHTRRMSRRRRGAVLIIVVAVGVMTWRAWSQHTAQAADKKNSGATGDHRRASRDQNGGTGTTAGAAQHSAQRASTDNAHADKHTSADLGSTVRRSNS